MKLALNGAITIGTLDGANIEIGEQVGAENILIFGLTASEVSAARQATPRSFVEVSPALAEALAAIRAGAFSPEDPQRYAGLVDGLLAHDHFLVAADFDAYAQAQRRAEALFADRQRWQAMALANTARVGWFSADRTIREYAGEIWQAPMRLG
jgi:starch phosphorylase